MPSFNAISAKVDTENKETSPYCSPDCGDHTGYNSALGYLFENNPEAVSLMYSPVNETITDTYQLIDLCASMGLPYRPVKPSLVELEGGYSIMTPAFPVAVLKEHFRSPACSKLNSPGDDSRDEELIIQENKNAEKTNSNAHIIRRGLEILRKFDPEAEELTIRIFLLITMKPGISMRDIHKKTSGDGSSAVTRNVAALGEFHCKSQPGHNLINIKDNPLDRRNKMIFPTAKGIRMFKECLYVQENA